MEERDELRKIKNKNQKRFSEKQIESLEMIFERETRLDPMKKIMLAKELGLQPRQVSIWFQNKRARWKSKQLEKEFNILRDNYNHLLSQFESMKKEKQILISELQRLNEKIQKFPQEIEKEVAISNNTRDQESYKEIDQEIFGSSDDNNNIKREYFGFKEEIDEDDLMNIVESTDSCLTFRSEDVLLDQTSSNHCPWWDFWS